MEDDGTFASLLPIYLPASEKKRNGNNNITVSKVKRILKSEILLLFGIDIILSIMISKYSQTMEKWNINMIIPINELLRLVPMIHTIRKVIKKLLFDEYANEERGYHDSLIMKNVDTDNTDATLGSTIITKLFGLYPMEIIKERRRYKRLLMILTADGFSGILTGVIIAFSFLNSNLEKFTIIYSSFVVSLIIGMIQCLFFMIIKGTRLKFQSLSLDKRGERGNNHLFCLMDGIMEDASVLFTIMFLNLPLNNMIWTRRLIMALGLGSGLLTILWNNYLRKRESISILDQFALMIRNCKLSSMIIIMTCMNGMILDYLVMEGFFSSSHSFFTLLAIMNKTCANMTSLYLIRDISSLKTLFFMNLSIQTFTIMIAKLFGIIRIGIIMILLGFGSIIQLYIGSLIADSMMNQYNNTQFLLPILGNIMNLMGITLLILAKLFNEIIIGRGG